MEERTDATLVTLARSGNKQAFGELIERYQVMAQMITLRLVGNIDIAREVVQEAMLQAYLSLDHLWEDTRFKGWFYGIVLNVSRSNLRERKRSVVSLEAMLTGSSSSENHLLYVLPDPQEVLEEQELQLEKILAFDNMQDRPIMGTSDWQQYEVVLDVSENGVQIAFGILLAGKGQVWLDEVQLELVSTPVQHA